jgi:hypothetical protein
MQWVLINWFAINLFNWENWEWLNNPLRPRPKSGNRLVALARPTHPPSHPTSPKLPVYNDYTFSPSTRAIKLAGTWAVSVQVMVRDSVFVPRARVSQGLILARNNTHFMYGNILFGFALGLAVVDPSDLWPAQSATWTESVLSFPSHVFSHCWYFDFTIRLKINGYVSYRLEWAW